MITKPFDKACPSDAPGRIGWEAEKQMAFHLSRAFEHAPDVHVFNDLRYATGSGVIEGDHVQIDHLVLHRHGIAIIESKATGDSRGEFHVDALGQWVRKAMGRAGGHNMPSPLHQAERQCEALRSLLDSTAPPLLGKKLGLIQARFRDMPMAVFVAIADNARLAGSTRSLMDKVMKAERIVAAIKSEIAAQRDGEGPFLRATSTARIIEFLLAHHSPLRAPLAPAQPPVKPAPRDAAASRPVEPRPQKAITAPDRMEKPEALTCRHCRSINVGVVHRKDYCLLCEECGRYTPLDWICRGCGKPATIRKRGAEFFRACDKDGGCGREVVFWRGGGG